MVSPIEYAPSWTTWAIKAGGLRRNGEDHRPLGLVLCQSWLGTPGLRTVQPSLPVGSVKHTGHTYIKNEASSAKKMKFLEYVLRPRLSNGQHPRVCLRDGGKFLLFIIHILVQSHSHGSHQRLLLTIGGHQGSSRAMELPMAPLAIALDENRSYGGHPPVFPSAAKSISQCVYIYIYIHMYIQETDA